ncbi:MAG: circadian clock KaiB family protein [Bacteroidales bacterium]|nr:circadian clock KaiB family protein [Bacteroidales bacterium]
MADYVLKLFISGNSARSKRAARFISEIADEHPDIHLDVIDVGEDSEPAEEFKVLATPTLIKTSPKPQLRIVGELVDKQKIIDFLDL